MCLGTNVCGHNRVWAQSCVGTIVWGHIRVWAQMCVGTNVCGHNRVWAQSCLGTIVCGHNLVWAQSCLGTNVSGHNRVGSIMYGPNRGGTVFQVNDDHKQCHKPVAILWKPECFPATQLPTLFTQIRHISNNGSIILQIASEGIRL